MFPPVTTVLQLALTLLLVGFKVIQTNQLLALGKSLKKKEANEIRQDLPIQTTVTIQVIRFTVFRGISALR